MKRNYKDLSFDESLKNKKCAICNEKAVAIIRTKFVCKRCFYRLNKDNKLKMNEREKITTNLKVIE